MNYDIEATEIIAELKAENDRLHERILKLTEENGSLIVQNNTLKENFDGQRNAYKKLNSMYEENCEYAGKLEHTLQEIKAIVKNICDGCTSECDCDEDCNYFLITEALTKAEEE